MNTSAPVLAVTDFSPHARHAALRAASVARQQGAATCLLLQSYLWRVRAAVLAATGDAAGAQALRDQALAAAQRTDAPESSSVTQRSYLGL